jgi:hypothetical protein
MADNIRKSAPSVAASVASAIAPQCRAYIRAKRAIASGDVRSTCCPCAEPSSSRISIGSGLPDTIARHAIAQLRTATT